jgi:hypothetical protein
MNFRIFLFIALCFCTGIFAEELLLRDNLRQAHVGDFLVTSINKNYGLLHIYSKGDHALVIEEITVPEGKVAAKYQSWQEWINEGAPCHTSWVMYEVDLDKGQIGEFFSFTKNGWGDFSNQEFNLSTLLNLRLTPIPEDRRKRVGLRPVSSRDVYARPFWQPRMIVNGAVVEGAEFDAWEATWPNDGSDLAGKRIEAYLPSDTTTYLSYFPYWLQISGMAGKAKIRIIDSGYGLKSPKPPLPNRHYTPPTLSP